MHTSILKKIYKVEKMINLIFGSSGSLGSSIIKITLKKYKKIFFLNISRTKPLGPKNRWLKYDLNKRLSAFKYKNVKLCIFLASPQYLKKNMNLKTFNKEYLWIRNVVDNLKIEKFIYVSSPSIYQKNHYIGENKYKIEKFLRKKKHKFKSLQIWRPFNLVNKDYKKYSEHFHSLLYKIMFIQKKSTFSFKGNGHDSRGFSDIDDFSKVLLKYAFLNKSFTKDYGNLNEITVEDIINIYNKFFYLKFKKNFKPVFLSKKINKNIIKKNLKNNVYSKQNSKNVIKKYLLKKLYVKNK